MSKKNAGGLITRRLLEQTQNRHYEPLIAFHRNGVGPPVILFPGRGGNILAFRDLTTSLSGRAVYGLVPRGWNKSDYADRDLGARVNRYHLALKSQFQNQTLCLVGWCSGGIAALEVLRMRAHEGLSGDRIIAINSLPPKLYHNGQQARDEKDVVGWNENGKELFSREWLGSMVERIRGYASRLRQWLFVARCKQLVRAGRQLPLAHRERYIHQCDAFMEEHYAVSPLSCDFLLFWSREYRPGNNFQRGSAATRRFDPSIAAAEWSKIVGRDLCARTLEGNHSTILKHPHVCEIAAIIANSSSD